MEQLSDVLKFRNQSTKPTTVKEHSKTLLEAITEVMGARAEYEITGKALVHYLDVISLDDRKAVLERLGIDDWIDVTDTSTTPGKRALMNIRTNEIKEVDL